MILTLGPHEAHCWCPVPLHACRPLSCGVGPDSLTSMGCSSSPRVVLLCLRCPQAVTSEGRQVAVKALSLRALRDWKQLDLFQREGKVLASLSHPGIPK